MKRAKKRPHKTVPTRTAMALTDMRSAKTDPQGSYTGVVCDPGEQPTQDADDL